MYGGPIIFVTIIAWLIVLWTIGLFVKNTWKKIASYFATKKVIRQQRKLDQQKQIEAEKALDQSAEIIVNTWKNSSEQGIYFKCDRPNPAKAVYNLMENILTYRGRVLGETAWGVSDTSIAHVLDLLKNKLPNPILISDGVRDILARYTMPKYTPYQ